MANRAGSRKKRKRLGREHRAGSRMQKADQHTGQVKEIGVTPGENSRLTF